MVPSVATMPPNSKMLAITEETEAGEEEITEEKAGYCENLTHHSKKTEEKNKTKF